MEKRTSPTVMRMYIGIWRNRLTEFGACSSTTLAEYWRQRGREGVRGGERENKRGREREKGTERDSELLLLLCFISTTSLPMRKDMLAKLSIHTCN